jgi:hypothetical protein
LGINFGEKYGTKEKRYKVDLNKSLRSFSSTVDHVNVCSLGS